MAPNTCLNSPDKFCYVCGRMFFKKQLKTITESVKVKYFETFGYPIRNQDKQWAPHNICTCCHRTMYNDYISPFRFVNPMRWMEPQNHIDDCYFCLTEAPGCVSLGYKHRATYPELATTHAEEMDQEWIDNNQRERDLDSPIHTFNEDDDPFVGHGHQFTQEELDNLVRELNLSKWAAEYLGSLLNQKGCLAPRVTFTYRNRAKDYEEFFTKEGKLVYCSRIEELMHVFKIPYNPSDWILFIDSSKASLKVVLLHNGNRYASVPIGHSGYLKEKYENLELILEKINYDGHKWVVVGDLKIISMILGQQGGYTKKPCFMCQFDTREKDRNDHWVKTYSARSL